MDETCIGWDCTSWNNIPIDGRRYITDSPKRIIHNKLNPFRKLKRSLKPFQSDQGDLYLINENGSIIGSSIILL